MYVTYTLISGNVLSVFTFSLLFSSHRLQEKHTREVLRDHLRGVTNLQAELKQIYDQIREIQNKIKQTHERQKQLLQSHGNKLAYKIFNYNVLFSHFLFFSPSLPSPSLLSPSLPSLSPSFSLISLSDVDFIKRSTEQETLQLFQLYDSLMEQKQEIENKLDDMEDVDIPSVYLSPRDRQILDWHFANLEFANASLLRALSLRHWDQDDDFEFTGAHLCLRDGYDAIPKAMGKGLDVRHKTAVTNVNYTCDGKENC